MLMKSMATKGLRLHRHRFLRNSCLPNEAKQALRNHHLGLRKETRSILLLHVLKILPIFSNNKCMVFRGLTVISVLWVELDLHHPRRGYLQLPGSTVDQDLCPGKLERIIIVEILDQLLLGREVPTDVMALHQ